MRTWLALIAVVLWTSSDKAAPVAGRPDLIAGPWETVAAPNAVTGLFINVAGRQINIAVYRRSGENQRWAWYVPGDSTQFDGRHLRVEGLEAMFEPDVPRFVGEWKDNGETRKVVLGRPRPAEGTPQPAVCGDWEGTLGSIHILQSVDGVLTAWMNRTISATDQRYGERLSIVSSGPQSVTLEPVMAGGPRYQFNAELSSDGTTLSGGWHPGLVAPSSLHKRHN